MWSVWSCLVCVVTVFQRGRRFCVLECDVGLQCFCLDCLFSVEC